MRAIRSVVAQTFVGLEVLIVDDGSTDGGARLLEGFGDSRLRLITQHNQGASAARNRGVGEGRGEWIAFLDADDEWRPTFLESVHSSSVRFPSAGAVYCAPREMVNGVALERRHSGIGPPCVVNYFRLLNAGEGPPMTSSSVAMRREVLTRTGPFAVGVGLGEDTDMWVRVAWSTTVVYVPEELAIVHRDASGTSWGNRKVEWVPRWVRTYEAWKAEDRIPQDLVADSALHYQASLIDRSLLLARRGRRLEALRSVWDAWRHGHVSASRLWRPLLSAVAPAVLRRWKQSLLP